MLELESDDWFRAIFEQIAAGMVITDAAGRFLSANPAFCQFLGYTEDELLKMGLLDVTHPDHRAEVQRNLNEVMAGLRQAFDLEKRCLRKDGTILWAHATAVCLCDEHANPIYCVAVMQDITERKRLEQELALRERSLNSFFTAAPAGLAILDAELRFLQINDTLAQMHGLAAPAHLGKTVSEVLPKMAPGVEPIFRWVLDTGEPALNFEVSGEMPGQPGVLRHWAASYFPILGADGKPHTVGVVVVELTELRRAEEALRASEERYRRFFERNLAGVFRSTLDGTMLDCNESFARILGYASREECMAHRAADFYFQPADREVALGRLKEQRILDSREVCVPRKDGSPVWVVGTASLIEGEEGRPAVIEGTFIDTTERKRAEERFRLAVESAPNGMVMVNEEGRIILVNSQTERLFGYSREELLGQSVEQLVPERFRHTHSALRASFAATPEPRMMGVGRDLYGLRKDGCEFPVEIGLNPIETERGVWVLSSVVDITERKRNEVVMAQLAAIVESSNDAIVGKTLDGTIVSWNAAAERIYGYSADEVKGRSISILVPPDRPDEVPQIQERLKRGELVEHFETVRVCKHGKQIDVSITFSPIKDASGKIIGSSAIARDITERKRTEAALRESEGHFRAVAEAAPNAFVGTNSTGRIITWNKTAQRMFQYTEEEVLGQRLTLIMPERYREDCLEGIQRYQQTGTARYIGKTMELHGLRKDGSEFPVEVSLSSWQTERGEFYHGIIRDITERKQAESALHESAERLQTLSRRLLEVQETERRSIARELHDEIGQALTAVKINLQTMQRLPEPSARGQYLEDSASIVERALQQVRNLSLDLRPSLLDDLGLAPALRWYVDRQAQRAGFTAQFVADPLETRLPADIETACFRVAQEAITNVVRHAQAERVQVELRRAEAELQLIVRDEGVGFDAGAAQARAARGASLGLLGMEERVLLAGGRMEIESTPGRGTQIRASFPL